MNLSAPPWDDARRQLEHVRSAGLERQLNHADAAAGATFTRDGIDYINFSSNNYLDLANDPRVKRAAQEAIDRYGAGAGGSRLIVGSLAIHRELELALAAFKGTEDALVFSSGYTANMGVVQVLSYRADGSRVPVVLDRLSHASIIDAVAACGAPWRTFAHNDMQALEQRLTRLPRGDSPRAVVITEGVFSMDGDLAPLPEILELCQRHDAFLVVDDAHGMGTVGPNGAGTVAHFGIASPRVVQMGTLSKALGSQGGYIAGPRILRDLLINRARAFIFDTALAPACAGAALESLRILASEPSLVQSLRQNAVALRDLMRGHGLSVPEDESPIIPVIVGSAEQTVAASESLKQAGMLVIAIRPPTVRPNTSRLRITVMASHTREQLSRLAEEIITSLPATV